VKSDAEKIQTALQIRRAAWFSFAESPAKHDGTPPCTPAEFSFSCS
jgi:hypothetical protein